MTSNDRGARLAIVMPIYNGASTVREPVESLAREFPGIEIVLHDNASTDASSEVCRELAGRYPNVRYFRNDSNVGFDRNCHLAVSRASREFCWLLGDDDLIRPKGVEAVLRAVEEHEGLGVLYVNYCCVDRRTQAVVKERDCDIHEDRWFPPGPGLLESVGEYPNFMSTLVFRRAAWMQADWKRYFDSYFVHYGVLLDVLQAHPSFCIAQPYVVNKSRISSAPRESDFWAKSVSVILSLLNIVLHHAMLRRAPAVRRSLANKMMSRYMLEKIKLMKVNGGRLSASECLYSVRLMKAFPLFWCYFPLLVTPYALQRPIVRLCNALLRR